MINVHPAIVLSSVTEFVIAKQGESGPVGPEFGKASPIGMLVVVLLAAAVLSLGWAFHRRWSRMNRRQKFAEKHGLDPFDIESVEKAMSEAGLADKTKKHFF